MMKRIYFLTSEIVPFAETYELATFSKEIPVVFNERKYDFRVMMPKYGFISERRYILREVIRLRDMELEYRNQKVKASVKSAFIPNTKVQVYFLEHEDYYAPTDLTLYQAAQDSDQSPNSIRFGYFAAAALTTLNYLRWKPEVIICNDWQMSLVPLLVQSDLLNREYFDGVKLVQIVHSKSELSKYALADYESIGLKDFDSSLVKDGKLDSMAAAMQISDHVLFVDAEGKLQDAYRKDSVFKSIVSENRAKMSTYQLKGQSEDDWQKLADEIITIIEKL